MRVVRAVLFLLMGSALCLAQNAANAVVTIHGTQNGGQVSGSGVVVAANGTIVTNLHLVNGLSNIKVELANGDIFDSFTTVATDPRRDIAVIRIAGFDLPFVALGNSNQIHPGDAVTVVSGAKNTTSATVQGFAPAEGFRLLQLSVSAQTAATGGVLLGADGKAIGILGYVSKSPVALAIPINYARGLLDSFPEVATSSGSDRPREAESAAAKPASVLPPPTQVTAKASSSSAPPVRQAEFPSTAPIRVTPMRETEPAPVAAAAPVPPPHREPAAAEIRREISPPEPKREAPVVNAAEKEPEPAAPAKATSYRPIVRKIYLEPIGSGEGPQLLRDQIVRTLEENHFKVVDTRADADAVLSGTGKWSHVRVERFRGRLVTADDHEIWSGELSTGGWIRAASGSIARSLVKNIVNAVGQPSLQQ